MSVFKCKMCGASLELSDNTKTVICDYCGSNLIGYERPAQREAYPSQDAYALNSRPYIQAQPSADDYVVAEAIMEERNEPEAPFAHERLYDVKFISFDKNRSKSINLLRDKLGIDWNEAGDYVDGKRILTIKGVYENEALYINQTFSRLDFRVKIEDSAVERNLAGPLRYREYKVNLISYANQKYKCRDLIEKHTSKSRKEAWDVVTGKSPAIKEGMSLREAIGFKELFMSNGYLVGIEEQEVVPKAKKSSNDTRIAELEAEKTNNLVAAIILLFFFWPVSIYFFVKMSQNQQEIDMLKSS